MYHIFRKGGGAYSLPAGSVTKNKLRTAAIWMDEFKFIVEDALGNPKMDIGPIDDMLALRKQLKCKPYSWYLKNVYPESLVTDLNDLVGYGHIKNAGTGQCLDTLSRLRQDMKPGMYACSESSRSQKWLFHKDNGIRPIANLELCMISSLQFKMCDVRWNRRLLLQMPWQLNQHNQLYSTDTKKCLTVISSTSDGSIASMPCDTSNSNQIWHIKREFR